MLYKDDTYIFSVDNVDFAQDTPDGKRTLHGTAMAIGHLSFINNNISDLLNDINIDTYLKLYVPLYADDTVILAESPRELQLALDAMD